MGGLGPGIGGFEILVIGLVALLVVGPKDLPVLMRRVGKVLAKARGMAAEFRASFDDMARQSELDDLRKEVEALRTGQGMHPLGPDAEAAFRDIKSDLDRPLDAAAKTPALSSPEGWDDPGPQMEPLAAPAGPAADAPKVKPRRKAQVEPASAVTTTKTGRASATKAKKPGLTHTALATNPASKPRKTPVRKPAPRTPAQ